jgi:hypothetical protein
MHHHEIPSTTCISLHQWLHATPPWHVITYHHNMCPNTFYVPLNLSEFGHIYHGKFDQPPSEQKQFAMDNWINN